ncbi:site-specific DNA-methyltransferase [Corynebacterium tapiri]|uniref:Site-specific DNA-methyltransferase n=1 Tax=Corynebacterium tapiri TaxID=1448266 RepID=A0A5C4U5V9_9CORY|nr:site-specific DNA-methyltransferase [Corynebacterium tapiri]TNL99443.1 site-specific DNA-methyltransferase [Corynebacterium tapiri]
MSQQKLELTWFNKDKALIPTETGKYGYTWVDPKDPRYCETHFLETLEKVEGIRAEKVEGQTYSEKADLEPQDDNLLILGESGDVLEALTRVPELREKYLGKVKLVYIDPPFNTSQTFANYEDNLEHSIWLTMMRDRLVHLRDLLSEDGLIWVHLDDVESHRMRLLLDEVFGSENFQAEVVWEKADSPRNDIVGISSDHDVILVYGKESVVSMNRMPRTPKDDAPYKNPDDDVTGPWRNGDYTAPGNMSGQVQHPSVHAIEHPLTGELLYPVRGRMWTFGKERLLKSLLEYGDYVEAAPDLELRYEKTGIAPDKLRSEVPDLILDPTHRQASVARAYERLHAGDWPEFFIKERSFGRKVRRPAYGQPARTWWPNAEVGHNRSAKGENRAMFGTGATFTTPKPERLLERIIHIATDPCDVVLDVFAGSGTTAAVAQKMGRRWVTCELVEDTFNRFTKARLGKVVNGEDQGGITVTKGERIDATEDGLPEGITPEEAQQLTSLINKAVKENDALKTDKGIKALKSLVKTAKGKDIINYLGGGGFTVAKLSPNCFNFDPETGLTSLTHEATGAVLVRSVAANLGFSLTPDNRNFNGVAGRQFLAVVEGELDTDKVDELMGKVDEGHSVLFAATIVNQGVRDHVRSFKNGSRVMHIPLDIFPYAGNFDEEAN